MNKLIPPEYMNQIVTGDARELAKRIPDKCAALAFIDLPYWVGFDYVHSVDTNLDYLDPNWLVSESMRISSIALHYTGNSKFIQLS